MTMSTETRKTTPSKKTQQPTAAAAQQAVKQIAGKQPVKNKAEGQTRLSPEDRYRLIQESAYYMAEKAGFTGNNVDYWLAAEAEVNRRYS
jgi:hypothetical protein